MNTFLFLNGIYWVIGILVASDYLLRLYFFNRKTGAKWSEYDGLLRQFLDMSTLWPKYMWLNIKSHYNPKDV